MSGYEYNGTQVFLLGTVMKRVCWKGGRGTHVANQLLRLSRTNPGLKLFLGAFVKVFSL